MMNPTRPALHGFTRIHGVAALAALALGGCVAPRSTPTAAPTCQFQLTPRADDAPVYGVQWLDPNRVLGSNHECFYLSEDRGRTFREFGCPPRVEGSEELLGHFQFLSRDLGWVIRGGDTLLRTQDGGKRWEAFSFPGFIIRDVFFVNPTTGIWVGEKSKGEGGSIASAAFVTRDGGQHWTELSLPPDDNPKSRLEGVWMRSDSEVWVVGEQMLTSLDGGRTWQSMSMSRETVLDLRNGSIQFHRGGVGWILRLPNENYLLTCDRGRSWMERPSLGTSFWPMPIDCEHVYALNVGRVMASDDGERTFHQVLDRDREGSGYHSLAYSEELGLFMALSDHTVTTCQLGADE